jgi:threonine/homoserine/homoserine lactone efflux protein
MAGLWAGNNLVGIAVVSGLAAIVFSVPYVRTVLLVASLCYLIYLAARIALAGSRIAFIMADRPPNLWNGLALQIINPKAYAVNTTLFTGFAFMSNNLMAETLIKFALLNAIWIPAHFAWLYAGATLKRLNLPERTQRTINILMALAMLLVVALALIA